MCINSSNSRKSLLFVEAAKEVRGGRVITLAIAIVIDREGKVSKRYVTDSTLQQEETSEANVELLKRAWASSSVLAPGEVQGLIVDQASANNKCIDFAESNSKPSILCVLHVVSRMLQEARLYALKFQCFDGFMQLQSAHVVKQFVLTIGERRAIAQLENVRSNVKSLNEALHEKIGDEKKEAATLSTLLSFLMILLAMLDLFKLHLRKTVRKELRQLCFNIPAAFPSGSLRKALAGHITLAKWAETQTAAVPHRIIDLTLCDDYAVHEKIKGGPHNPHARTTARNVIELAQEGATVSNSLYGPTRTFRFEKLTAVILSRHFHALRSDEEFKLHQPIQLSPGQQLLKQRASTGSINASDEAVLIFDIVYNTTMFVRGDIVTQMQEAIEQLEQFLTN